MGAPAIGDRSPEGKSPWREPTSGHHPPDLYLANAPDAGIPKGCRESLSGRATRARPAQRSEHAMLQIVSRKDRSGIAHS